MIGLLGPFHLRTGDGTPVEPGGARVRALLARLVLDVNRTVSVGALVEDLWGGSPPSAELNALQSLVSRARRALPGSGVVTLESTSAGYRLMIDADSVDAHRFERLVELGRGELAAGDADSASRTLREALGLWRGEALVDVDAAFAEAARARLDERRLVALEARVEADLLLGRHAEVVAELDVLAERHPLREPFTALRMRALYGSGRQAEALAAYDSLRRRLADELGVDPAVEVRDLHVAMLRGTVEEPDRPREPGGSPDPGGTSAPSARPALPLRVSSFVGREDEIDQVAAAVRESRLVTLFGPGGAGKTRLATESATGFAAFRVVFVELAPVRDSHDLASAVLSVIGSREPRLLEVQTATRQSVVRLVEVLSSEPTLLVLDNCEHLIDAAAALVGDLLARCAELRVLTTSREPLALTGETLLPVGPLGLPDELGDPAEAAAVRLFAERARATSPAFTLDAATVGDVVEICRRLDGMPLAIELAAARLRSMSVRQIAERLDDRFRLLTGGNRTSMPRHRTLRAVVEWSWELLTEQERQLAARLSVFTGPARVESVAAVCSGAGLPHGDVVYVLSSLVEKSLVDAVDGPEENGVGGDAGMRYRTLETVRAYCAERLDEAGESAATRTAHAAHFLEFAETAAPSLQRGDQLEWLQRLDRENDNVLTALHRYTASGDAEGATRLAAALGWYWSAWDNHSDVLARLREVMDVPGRAPERSRAVVELMLAFFDHGDGWTDRLRRGAARVRDCDAMSRYHYLAVFEPLAWMLVGEFAEMDTAVRRALELPDAWAHAAGMYAAAAGAEHRGDLRVGEEYARSAAEEFAKVGDRWGYAQAISMRAGFLSLSGDHVGAIEVYTESVDSVRQLRSSEDLVPQLVRIGWERARAGDVDGARESLREAEALSDDAVPHHRMTVSCGFAEIARVSGDLVRARRYLDEARRLLDEPTAFPAPMRQMVLAFDARTLVDEGELERARERLATAVEIGRDGGDMPMTGMLADRVARVLFAEGSPERAARMLGVGKAMRGVLDEGDPDVRSLRADLDAALGPQAHRRAFGAGADLARGDAHAELARALGG